MQVQEVNLNDILDSVAMTIQLSDREEKPTVDPELVARGLDEDMYYQVLTPLDLY